MKIKKIILVILFSILTLNNHHNNIYAEKGIVEETIQEHTPQIKKSSVSKDESSLHENVESYLQAKYGTQNWHKENSNTTEKVLGVKPIEMQSNIFESDRLDNAMIAAGKKTKYAGCGPVAIIGMVDFFARYFGYSEISINPDDIILQEKIAEEVLRNIKTRDVNTSNYGKQTLALPWDCTDGFNKVMKNHNLENTIQATDMGFFGVSKREKILKIKEQIDKGLPVTLYTAMAGEGPLGDHYVNVYGYEEWHGKDQNGRNITHTMLEIRSNWGKPSSSQYYMDSDILGSFITGIIYYDIIYKYQCLPDMLFMTFKNEQNQGQYFNEVVESPLSIMETKISFMTRRLRCSYLNQGYFVLSANRDNHDTAYLELEFEEEVRQIGLNLCLWSHKEQFSNKSSLRLEYFDEVAKEWKTIKEMNPLLLPLKEEPSKTNSTIIPKGVKKIRIIVENKGITTDRNKGRIVIDYIDVYFDTKNQIIPKPHRHSYGESYEYINEFSHKAYCKCGEYEVQSHIALDSENPHTCSSCNGFVHTHTYNWKIEPQGNYYHNLYCECGSYITRTHSYTHSYESIDEQSHRVYCECGDFVTKEHTWIIQNGKKVCQYCDYEEHTHHYIYEEYNETHHKKVCECGDIIMEEHSINTSNQIHGTFECDKCNQSIEIAHNFNHHYHHKDMEEHMAYCECGEFIIESHNFNHSYYNNCEEFHEIFCRCGNSIAAEHNYVCEFLDEQSHQYRCICGRTYNEEHSIDTTGKEYGEFGNCIYCNEEILIPHSYGISYEYDESSKHRSFCECGNYIEEEHEFKFYHSIDAEYHVVYCKCAKPIIEQHTLSENGICIYCNHGI